MSTSTPACMRGSLPVSKAHENGFEAGAKGLSRDVNPYYPGHSTALCIAWDEGWCDGRYTLNTENES